MRDATETNYHDVHGKSVHFTGDFLDLRKMYGLYVFEYSKRSFKQEVSPQKYDVSVLILVKCRIFMKFDNYCVIPCYIRVSV